MKKIIATLGMAFLIPGLAGAGELGNTYPKLKGQILMEYKMDFLSDNDGKIGPKDKTIDGFAYIKPTLGLEINKYMSLNTTLEFRPVRKRIYAGDRYARQPQYIVGGRANDDFYGKEDYITRKIHFGDYGLSIETLSLDFTASEIGFGIGKINPRFGQAFDKTRFSGVFGTVVPEEYQLKEKIGGYVSAIFPTSELTFSMFFDDTTGLSRTGFKDRGRDKSSNGAGNTEKPNNFAISFAGNTNNLGYNIGFRYLDVDNKYERPEKGFVAGLEYLMEFGDYGIAFMPFVEAAYFYNFDGMKHRDVYFMTAFLPVIYGGWHFVLTDTIKHDRESGYRSYTDYLLQLSVGYKFANGIMIDVAKVYRREEGKADLFLNADGNTYRSQRHKFLREYDSWAGMISYVWKF